MCELPLELGGDAVCFFVLDQPKITRVHPYM